MKKANLALFLIFSLILFLTGCGGGGNGSGGGTSPDPESEDYAPSNIYSKSLKVKGDYNYTMTNFTSGGRFSIPEAAYVSFIGTPSYSYSKTSENTAKFYSKYAYRMHPGSSNYSDLSYTLDLRLNFLGSDIGNFTGTIKVVTTGAVEAINGTKTYTKGGTFSFY